MIINFLIFGEIFAKNEKKMEQMDIMSRKAFQKRKERMNEKQSEI